MTGTLCSRTDFPEPDVLTLEVNMEAITETEVARAVSKLKNGKAAGTDHIQPDLLKHAETVIPHLTKLFNTVWQSKEVSA